MNEQEPSKAKKAPKPSPNAKGDDYDIQTIEKHIQNLLNLLIKGLQRLKVEEETFDRFQGVFYSSDSLEEYLDGLHDMLKVLVNGTGKRLDFLEARQTSKDSEGDNANKNKDAKNAKNKHKKGNGDEHAGISKNAKQKRFETESALADPNYESLERVLQKYEAEIREHIRIEQQLKIYSDGLEEKVTEKEAEMTAQEAGFKKRIEVLNEDKAKLSKLLYDAKFEKIFLEKKLKKGRESSTFHLRDSREPSLRKGHRVRGSNLIHFC